MADVHGAVAHGPGVKEVLGVLNVLVVLALIVFGARKGIMASLRGRTESVAKKLRESKEELKRVEATLAQTKSQLASFESLQQKMMEEVRREGEVLTRNFLEEATVSADRILLDARLAAKDEARSAAQRLRQQLVDEALGQASLMIGSSEEQKKNIHRQLVDSLSEGIKGGLSHGR